MRFARLVPVMYWTAVGVFLVGVTARVLADVLAFDALDDVGQVISMIAWPLAVVAAALDVHRHARASAEASAGVASDADPEPHRATR